MYFTQTNCNDVIQKPCFSFICIESVSFFRIAHAVNPYMYDQVNANGTDLTQEVLVNMLSFEPDDQPV